MKKQYFITVEVGDLMIGSGRTRATSLKSAQKYIREEVKETHVKLKTYPTDRKSYRLWRDVWTLGAGAYHILENGHLILSSVWEKPTVPRIGSNKNIMPQPINFVHIVWFDPDSDDTESSYERLISVHLSADGAKAAVEQHKEISGLQNNGTNPRYRIAMTGVKP